MFLSLPCLRFRVIVGHTIILFVTSSYGMYLESFFLCGAHWSIFSLFIVGFFSKFTQCLKLVFNSARLWMMNAEKIRWVLSGRNTEEHFFPATVFMWRFTSQTFPIFHHSILTVLRTVNWLEKKCSPQTSLISQGRKAWIPGNTHWFENTSLIVRKKYFVYNKWAYGFLKDISTYFKAQSILILSFVLNFWLLNSAPQMY